MNSFKKPGGLGRFPPYAILRTVRCWQEDKDQLHVEATIRAWGGEGMSMFYFTLKLPENISM